MTAQELTDAGVVKVNLIVATTEMPDGITIIESHDLRDVSDTMLKGLKFVNVSDDMTATYTI